MEHRRFDLRRAHHHPVPERQRALLPGTVILTGRPHGIGMAADPQPRWLKAGDRVSIEVDRIGVLTNIVTEESPTTA